MKMMVERDWCRSPRPLGHPRLLFCGISCIPETECAARRSHSRVRPYGFVKGSRSQLFGGACERAGSDGLHGKLSTTAIPHLARGIAKTLRSAARVAEAVKLSVALGALIEAVDVLPAGQVSVSRAIMVAPIVTTYTYGVGERDRMDARQELKPLKRQVSETL